jgi:hypothetical protein
VFWCTRNRTTLKLFINKTSKTQKFLANNKAKINLCFSETCFGVNDDWT